ncbi:hypothetical protein T10_2815, partial [Trichinella papuae]
LAPQKILSCDETSLTLGCSWSCLTKYSLFQRVHRCRWCTYRMIIFTTSSPCWSSMGCFISVGRFARRKRPQPSGLLPHRGTGRIPLTPSSLGSHVTLSECFDLDLPDPHRLCFYDLNLSRFVYRSP